MAITFLNARPWRQQYLSNEAQSGDITGWQLDTSLPVATESAQALITKDRVYLLGGSGPYDTVRTAPIDSSGIIGAWTTSAPMPTGISESQAVITRNRVYLLGGYITGGHYTALIHTAPINTDGTFGTWATAGNIPASFGQSQVIVTENRVYLLGGYTGGFLSSIYTAPIDSDGIIGSWSAATSLPGGFAGGQAFSTGGRIYLVGGWTPSGPSDIVYTAPVDPAGFIGAWTTGTPLSAGLAFSQAVVVKGMVYLLGGEKPGGVYTNQVLRAVVNVDGTIGTWSSGTVLAAGRYRSQAVVTSSRVYLIGGGTGSGAQSTVQYASFAGGANDYMDASFEIPPFWTNFHGESEIIA